MNILLEVITPGNGRSYDIMINDKLTVGAAKEKIIEQIVALENGCISFDQSAALFSRNSRIILDDSRNLRKAGVRGGQTVFML